VTVVERERRTDRFDRPCRRLLCSDQAGRQPAHHGMATTTRHKAASRHHHPSSPSSSTTAPLRLATSIAYAFEVQCPAALLAARRWKVVMLPSSPAVLRVLHCMNKGKVASRTPLLPAEPACLHYPCSTACRCDGRTYARLPR
jgi:hypothetical protein